MSRRARRGGLVLSFSRRHAAFSLFVHFGSAVLVTVSLVELAHEGGRTPGPTHWALLALAVGVFLPSLLVKSWHDLDVWSRGRTFAFDPKRHAVFENGERLASFDEIEALQVRRIALSLTELEACEHRLSLLFKDGRKLCIAQSSDEGALADAADDIAEAIRVPLRRK